MEIGNRPVDITDDLGESSLYITAWINDKPIECLIDSGASISVINFKEYQSRKSALLKPLSRCRRPICIANGQTVEAPGIAHLPLGIDDTQFEVPLVIADIAVPVILGMDFIRKQKGIIDSNNNEVILNGVHYKCHDYEMKSHIFRVTVAEDIEIPANSEMIIPGKIDGMHSQTAVIECNGRLPEEYGVLVARGLVKTAVDVIPIRTANLTNDDTKLYKGTVIASGQPVENDTTFHPLVANVQVNKGCEDPDEIPEYLQDLWTVSTRHLDDRQRSEATQLLLRKKKKFAKNKSDLGRTKVVRHSINNSNKRPIKIRPGRMPQSKREEGKKEIQRMLDQGIIVPSKSPWAAPVVLVRKKDGSVRVCTDFRQLNKHTIKDSYPLPRIDDSLDALGGSMWFSTLDLASGFWQVEMDPKDQEKTAFSMAGGGLYEYKVMPFGLANSPATFERLMEQVLMGLHWQTCLVYLDDIIVFSETFETHLARLEEVIDRIGDAGLKLSPKKCKFFQREVSFLGHTVNKDGISTDSAKIQSVKEWPRPKSVKEVRSFLGLCSYYRKFVSGFATIAKPLHELTQKDRAFLWTEDCQRAFESLKSTLISAPVLAYPSPEGALILDTDASGVGLGAVLSQIQGDSERVIAYYSRTLDQPERQYCVTRRELLALVAACKQFHNYLYGRKVIVRTDHGALRWLLTFKNPEGQVARWLERLGNYDLDIQHRAGKAHGNADALSRRPCGECKHCLRLEERDKMAVSSDCITKVCMIQTHSGGKPPWLVQHSVEDLQKLQSEDDSMSKIISWKNQGERPPWKDVKHEGRLVRILWSMWKLIYLQDGILYKKDENTQCSQLIVPMKLKQQILTQVHNHRLGGHFGVKKTLHNVRSRFWWPGMRDDVCRWCRTCGACQRRNPRSGSRMPLYQDLVGSPMERMAMDILSFREQTENGNTCVLVVTDYFTKWTEAFALPDHQALTVADTLVTEVFLKFGVPRILHSDQGPEFQSELIQEICRLLEVQQTRTTPYRPQSDGQVERFNRTLIAMLSKFCAENKQDWDDHLPFMMCAYRATINESSGCSPNLAMLGREITLMYPIPDRPREYSCITEYVEWLKETLQNSFEEIRKHLSKSATRQKNYYDRRSQMREFKRGDWVLRFYPPGLNRSKLNLQYIGPYLVLSRQGEVTYKIQLGPQNKPITVHVDHLKHFECEQPPQSWVEIDTVRETPHTDDNGIVTQLPDPSDTQSTLRNNVPQEDTTLETTSEHKRNLRTQRRRKMPSKFRDYLI